MRIKVSNYLNALNLTVNTNNKSNIKIKNAIITTISNTKATSDQIKYPITVNSDYCKIENSICSVTSAKNVSVGFQNFSRNHTLFAKGRGIFCKYIPRDLFDFFIKFDRAECFVLKGEHFTKIQLRPREHLESKDMDSYIEIHRTL
jgi:hypothetical protein